MVSGTRADKTNIASVRSLLPRVGSRSLWHPAPSCSPGPDPAKRILQTFPPPPAPLSLLFFSSSTSTSVAFAPLSFHPVSPRRLVAVSTLFFFPLLLPASSVPPFRLLDGLSTARGSPPDLAARTGTRRPGLSGRIRAGDGASVGWAWVACLRIAEEFLGVEAGPMEPVGLFRGYIRGLQMSLLL